MIAELDDGILGKRFFESINKIKNRGDVANKGKIKF